jgi:membrane-associated protease RseP (regulator of RpoE activity)
MVQQPAPISFVGDGRLQREAVVLVHDRGRFAVLVSVCTLAGVALGFTLASLSGAGSARCDHGEVLASADVAPVIGVEPGVEPDPSTGPLSPGPRARMHRGPHSFGGQLGGVDIWQNDPRAWLGVNLEDAPNGARVTQVMNDSPAHRAGIQPDDVITRVDAESIATASQLVRLVQDHDPGDTLALALDRGGSEVTLEVSLDAVGGSKGLRIR